MKSSTCKLGSDYHPLTANSQGQLLSLLEFRTIQTAITGNRQGMRTQHIASNRHLASLQKKLHKAAEDHLMEKKSSEQKPFSNETKKSTPHFFSWQFGACILYNNM